MGPLGCRFLKEVWAANRCLFVWTVNEAVHMRWCLREAVDGVVTDEPEELKRICESWDDRSHKEHRITLSQHIELYLVALPVILLSWAF
jgi:hypothetical protein